MRAGSGGAKDVGGERLPPWLAPVVYGVVLVVLFREVVFTGAGLLGIDSMALSYFARHFYTTGVAQRWAHSPRWNPLVFGGLPFVEGMHGDVLTRPRWPSSPSPR